MDNLVRPLVVVSQDARLAAYLAAEPQVAKAWRVTSSHRLTAPTLPDAVWLVDVRASSVDEIAQLGLASSGHHLAIALVQPSGVGQAVAAMRAGFYLACEPSGLAATLDHVHEESQLGTQVAVGRQSLPKHFQRLLAALTPKERDVLDLVLAGLPNKNIAKRLGYSLKTIEVRRQSVMRKLQVDSLAELVRVAMTAEPNWRLLERLQPTGGAQRRLDAPVHCPPATAFGSPAAVNVAMS